MWRHGSARREISPSQAEAFSYDVEDEPLLCPGADALRGRSHSVPTRIGSKAHLRSGSRLAVVAYSCVICKDNQKWAEIRIEELSLLWLGVCRIRVGSIVFCESRRACDVVGGPYHSGK